MLALASKKLNLGPFFLDELLLLNNLVSRLHNLLFLENQLVELIIVLFHFHLNLSLPLIDSLLFFLDQFDNIFVIHHFDFFVLVLEYPVLMIVQFLLFGNLILLGHDSLVLALVICNLYLVICDLLLQLTSEGVPLSCVFFTDLLVLVF